MYSERPLALPIALAGRLLVMQPVLNLVLMRFSASTISGRRSPDNSGSTSLPRTSAPSASDSVANNASNASISTSARSNFAQAFSRWLAALVPDDVGGQAAFGLV